MVALYDHIQQLRAELATNIDAGERAHISRELAAARHDKLEAELAADADGPPG